MPPITHGSRLDRLRNLRDRVDAEIRSIERAHAHLIYGVDAPADLIRVWAREHGIKVADTGKLSNRVRAQYLAANRDAS